MHKRQLLVASVTIAALTTYLFLFTSPTTNYRIAYIKKERQGYKLALKGKRLYMAHDAVSLLLRKTYEDSTYFIIPRSEGIIKGNELPSMKEYYNSVGAIIIKGRQLKIELYTDNHDNKTVESNIWNGNYELVWRRL